MLGDVEEGENKNLAEASKPINISKIMPQGLPEQVPEKIPEEKKSASKA